MWKTVPHQRHRRVCHPTARAIASARMPRAPGAGVPVDRGARGRQRMGHGPVTGRQDGVSSPRRSGLIIGI